MDSSSPQLSAEVSQYLYDLLQNVVNSDSLASARLMEAGLVYHLMLRELTKTQQQFFSSDYERLIVILDLYDLPAKISGYLKRCGYLIQKIAKNPHLDVELKDLQQTVLTICLTLQHLSEMMPPTDLYDFCKPLLLTDEPDEKTKPSNLNREQIPLLKGVVKDYTPLLKTKDDKPYFILTCYTDDYEQVSIYIWSDFVYLHPLMWQYARINITHIQLQNPANFEENNHNLVMAVTAETLITLDPDFLLDVTSISQTCLKNGAHHSMYLFKKFSNDFSNYYLLRGNIVNAYLDANLRNEEPSVLDLFKQYIIINPTHALTFSNDDFRKLKDELIKHLATINSPVVQQFKQHELSIEPTFLSEKFGLRGRLDVLVNYEQDPDHQDVIELKTSKDPLPYRQVNMADAMQAVSYHLLLESRNPAHKGSSAILYSSVAPENSPLRNVSNDMKAKRFVLYMRNQIVASEYRLTFNPEEVLAQVNSNIVGSQNLFPNDIQAFDSFRKILSDCKPLELKYFYEWIAFTAREQRASKIGGDNNRGDWGFSGLWNNQLGFKELDFTILAFLKFRQIDQLVGDCEIIFDKTEGKTLQVARFRVGDMVLLYPHEPEDESLKPTKHQILKATIKQLTKDMVVISPMNKFIRKEHFENYHYWAFEAESTDMSYDIMYQSLYEFVKLPSEKKSLILGLTPPVFSALPEQLETDILKPQQLLTLQKALSAQNYFLLQGPPGTGKTKVMIRRLVSEILKNPDEKIILLAFTNRAVDEICEAVKDLQDTFRIFRLGYGSATEHPELLLSKFAKHNELKTTKKEIQGCRIFISTVLTYQRSPELRKYLEDRNQNPKLTAIIDEASQLLEPQIIGLLGKVSRFIMIGDEKQLPAVVVQGDTTVHTNETLLNEVGINNLSVSLFERLLRQCQQKGWHDAYDMLQDQGRMHIHIARYPSRFYYENRLQHIEERQTAENASFLNHNLTFTFPFLETLWKQRTIFISTEKENERNRNKSEARLVELLVAQLKLLFNTPEELEKGIGIITPYRTQIAEIKNNLNDEINNSIVVDTVERYQGGQKNIIIVSLAVNNPAQLNNLHVLNAEGNVDKKLNVTLTRAKEYLIIIGCMDILKNSPIYQSLLQYYSQNNAIFNISSKNLQLIRKENPR
ncbi:MAG: AAA family ATPase [Sphingobacteriales bacterium]|nr:MAG: AAA family ATPase [Sphingobacteriales bacterium]